MRYLILLSLILSTGCAKTIEYVNVSVDVPKPLRTPCEISERKVKTANELGALATEHLNTALCANSKIVAIDEILIEGEKKAGPQ